MSDGRAVPSGKVYRQLFDAQVQLSRFLLDGRRHTRTACLSAEDRSTSSRCLGPLSSRGQQLGADDDFDDVSRLPVAVVVDHSSSDIIERLTEKKSRKHEAAVQQLEAELTELTQVCETRVRAVGQELLSSLQEVNLRLNSLKDRMEQLDHEELVSLQEVCALWEEVEEEVKLKKMRIMELNHKLTEVETQRSDEITVVLRKYCHLLEEISFLPPSDVCRLIHGEAMMLNQSLLANRRSVAHLLLLLQEENLQQESLLHLHWEDCLSRWRRSRVKEVIGRFRRLCSSEEGQRLLSGQQTVQEATQTLRDVTQRRRDIIYKMCSLVPPSCSPALVCDWFNQLTAINQQIDSLHADFFHQLRCCSEQTWQDRLAEVERCEEALLALQLSEEEVKDIVSSELLTLIGRRQSQDEDRLAALDLCYDSAAGHALRLSRCVFFVMRGAALLWETHSSRLKMREEELQQHLDNLRSSQQKRIQERKVRLDDLLLDRLPSLFLEELLSYSSSLSSFYHLNHTYRPSPEELKNLHPSSTCPIDPGPNEEAEIQNHPIRNNSEPSQPSQDWLTEAESALLDLCDISSDVTFTSPSGVAYSGPAFICPAPDLTEDQQQETHLSIFPVELLAHTLSRTRTLFLDHLEQHFHDALSSAVARATDRKEAVRLEQELQLQQPNADHIQKHIYQPRLAELQLHRQRVDVHCEEVLELLTSCRVELQELQASISRKNQKLTVTLSNMEDDLRTADSSRRVEALSSTLQGRLDQHIKDTQDSQTSFRQTVQTRLEGVRNQTTQLLNSFRLCSEGGDFSPQEVKMFQRRLKEETKQISVTEESIYTDLEEFESQSLQQVKEASDRFEEKILLLKSEVKFTEKIQSIICSTQVQIKAEAASSNQQQSAISSRLEDLRRMIEDTQVSPDQVCSLVSSVNKDLRRRSQYLDFSLDSALPGTLSAHPKPRKQVLSAPPSVLLQPSRTGVDLLNDPVVDVIKSLNRFCMIQDEAPEEDENMKTAAGSSPVQRLQQRSVSTLSVRRSCRSIRTDRRFQLFGSDPEQTSHSFSSSVNSVLWKANDVLLSVAEDFYHSERCGLSRLLLLPDSLDQWAESTQQRLLGYQEQARRLLSTSREELVKQVSLLEELLHLLPSALFSNCESHQEAELRHVMGGVRLKMEETLAANEKEKRVNIRRLRASLRDAELQSLNSREELRQQQLHSAICCAHQELQECVRVRGEKFVTSLASLTENLLSQLDNFYTPAETKTVPSHRHSEDDTVTMETGAEPGQKPCIVSSTADLPSSVTTATASITMNRCTLGHLAVIEQRDAAVKRFEQLLRSESSHSDDDKQRRLRELQSWNTHWRQQIHIHTQNTH